MCPFCFFIFKSLLVSRDVLFLSVLPDKSCSCGVVGYRTVGLYSLFACISESDTEVLPLAAIYVLLVLPQLAVFYWDTLLPFTVGESLGLINQPDLFGRSQEQMQVSQDGFTTKLFLTWHIIVHPSGDVYIYNSMHLDGHCKPVVIKPVLE